MKGTKTMCKINKWQYLPRDLWFLKWKALGASSRLYAFIRLRQTSEDFGLLRKTSDVFGNLRKWLCRLQKSQHSQDKNLTPISQKKLAGIMLSIFVVWDISFNLTPLNDTVWPFDRVTNHMKLTDLSWLYIFSWTVWGILCRFLVGHFGRVSCDFVFHVRCVWFLASMGRSSDNFPTSFSRRAFYSVFNSSF